MGRSFHCHQINTKIGAIPGIIAGGIGGASTGAFSNLLNAAAFGGDLSQAMASGAIAGAVTGGLIGGIGGYVKAQKLKLNPWTGKMSTTTQPNSADDLLATGGSDEFYGRPVEELKYNIREINVDIVDDLYEYDITFALKRFHTFQQTIPQNLPGVIGTMSCLSGVAAYITDKWTAEAIRNDWNGGKDASGDYEDFVNKYFKGGSRTRKDRPLMDMGSFANQSRINNYGEISMIKGASSINHAVSPVGWRGNNIVFFDPASGGFRYMPYSEFKSMHEMTYFNLIPK